MVVDPLAAADALFNRLATVSAAEDVNRLTELGLAGATVPVAAAGAVDVAVVAAAAVAGAADEDAVSLPFGERSGEAETLR